MKDKPVIADAGDMTTFVILHYLVDKHVYFLRASSYFFSISYTTPEKI